MSATTTTTPEQVTSPATLSTYEPADGSKIDRSAYIAAGEALIAAMDPYTSAMLAAGEASRQGAEASLALRVACRRADNDAPDFAGNTDAYAFAWGSNLARSAVKFWPEETDEERARRVERYRTAVRRYMSDSGMVHATEALWVAANDPKVKTTTDEVRKAIAAKEKIPADVKAGIDRVQAKQTNAAGTKRLNGMEKATIPAKFGPKEKKSGSRKDDNATSNTPAKAWETLRGDVLKLAPDIAADELLHLVSAMILGPMFLGPIDGKTPPAKAGRKKGIETVRQIRDLLDATLKYEDGKVTTKEGLAEHLWSDKK